MKKALAALLSLALLLTNAAFGLADEVDPYGPVTDGERVVITVGREESANVTCDPGENSEDNYIVRYLEENLNVDYQYAFSVDTSTYTTKVNMAIASGDIPDVMNVSYTQLVQLVEADALEDMTEAFKTYSSPSLRKCFASTGGLTESLGTFDGKLMGIGDICPGMDAVPVLWVRGDWLEACGLEEPKTWDDVVHVAKTFLEQNPGGNVTTGIAVSDDYYQPNGGVWQLNALFNYFGAYPKQWVYDKDGKVIYGSIAEESKTALAAISELVKEGVLNASLAVTDGDQCYEMVANGQCGMFFGAWWSGQWPVVSILEGLDDSVSLIPVLAPLGEDGMLNVCAKSPTNTYVVVKKGCSEEIKEAVVKTINYQYDLDQAQAEDVRPNGMDSNFSWHYYPINVLHCDFDAKENQIADVMRVIAGEMDYEDQCGDGKTWYNGYTTVMEKGLRAAFETNLATANAWGWATGAWKVESNSDKIRMFNEVTYADTPSMERLWTAMETLEEEFFLKVMIGEASLDGWDAFVSEWKSIGGDTITAEIEAYVASK